jgi:transcriptional regulator with XRE-family HTH domain
MEISLGDRLRTARLRSGLSQRALAKKAGIGNATVSLIEADRINPSVSALKRILDAIDMPLSDFFAMGSTQTEQQVFRADELTEIGRGGISFRKIGNDLARRALQVMYETYQPGSDTGKIMLHHAGEEAGFVISGRVEITIGSAIHVLAPGDAYYFKSTEPHRFRNASAEPAVVVSVCTPPTF